MSSPPLVVLPSALNVGSVASRTAVGSAGVITDTSPDWSIRLSTSLASGQHELAAAAGRSSPYSVSPHPAAHALMLPCHYHATTRYGLGRCEVPGLPLPLREEWGDSFNGRCLLRIPQGAARSLPRESRLRSTHRDGEVPSMYMWDHCRAGRNTLEHATASRARGAKAQPFYALHGRSL